MLYHIKPSDQESRPGLSMPIKAPKHRERRTSRSQATVISIWMIVLLVGSPLTSDVHILHDDCAEPVCVVCNLSDVLPPKPAPAPSYRIQTQVEPRAPSIHRTALGFTCLQPIRAPPR